MIIRAMLVLAIVGLFSGQLADAVRSARLGAIRAEIAAAHPYARLGAQVNDALGLLRKGTMFPSAPI